MGLIHEINPLMLKAAAGGGGGTLWDPSQLGSTAFRVGLRSMYTDGSGAGAEITQSAGAVSQWSDWSGNANHFVQATSGAKPTYSASVAALGSKPGVVFDGSTDFLGCTLNFTGVGHTVFIVMMTGDYKGSLWEVGPSGFNEQITFINFDRYFRCYLSTDQTDKAEALSEDFTNPHIYEATILPALRAIYLDGLVLNSDTTSISPTLNSGNARIGMTLWDGEPSDMSVGEYVVIGDTLSDANREKIEGYLAWKWGLQGNLPALHPYKSAPPYV